MALIINEEQQMLKSSAHSLLAEKAPVSALRKLRDTNDEKGYDPQLWKEMAEMGWASMIIPEAYGGLDFGYTGLGQVLEESGRTLTASPLVSTALLGAAAINLGGSDRQKQDLLPKIAEGELVTALATDESTHHDPTSITTTVSGDGTLNGRKIAVMDGHIADAFIVAAKADSGVELYLVDSDADGVAVERVSFMDSRNYAEVKFDNVVLSAESRLAGYADGGQALLGHVLDIGRIGLAAEMLGGIQETFERTLDYIKERKQFGVPIGSFQALQHRAAEMFCEIELCKSIVIKSLKALDEESDDISRLASLAKAKLGMVYQLVSNEGVQMHGGIGMTDEVDIGFFLKRARVAQRLFGDANYHLNRLADMRGI